MSFKLFEIELISLATNQLNYLNQWVKQTPVAAVTAQDLYTLSKLTGLILRWLSLPIALIAVLLLCKLHPGNKLSKIHNMKTLLESMQGEFPETQPIIGKKLDEQDINEGPWRMALTPVEFMKEHNLLKSNKMINKGLASEIF
ncbi:hypothetical protein [Piscirickettsia litoralis]|uniref:hypothetical protein n=1 Tax=Piscirickettsia litoralis TaxID=1891921 RepID=UPI001F35DA65|nr:hypothetical protein [Piscirickettsia litoralis]